jgi:glutathione synthase/RimK-type ligase-like ATP-grasp enzyme
MKQLANKMAKTSVLLASPAVAPHIPPTADFTSENLRNMLHTHHFVVIKPYRGSGGHGVIKVSQEEDGGYSYKSKATTRYFTSFDGLVKALGRLKGSRRYLIQKGITLATVHGRPIDYRYKYVKNGRVWETRAIVGRVARGGYFITNLCRGGRLLKGGYGIRLSLGKSYVKPKKQEMRRLAKLCTDLLLKRYPGLGSLGFDFGIDKNGKIWIFEVNTNPH